MKDYFAALFLIRVYLRSSAADLLERKERFELSNRVWKTRMFPATSLPGFGVRRQSEAATAPWIGGEDYRTLNCDLRPKRRRAGACRRSPNWNSWQDSNPQPRRSKRRALPVELQERKRIWSIVPDCPMSQVQGPKSVFRRLTLDFKRWTLNYPLTQTTCLISATISTRSSWFFITASIDL